MRFDKMMRAVGPFVIAAAMSGAFTVRKDGKFKFNCDSDKFRFNGKTGVKLEDLDMGEDLPTEVVLVGPDQLVITEGEDFAISVQGDDEAKDGARFLVDGDTLYVMRGDFCSGDDEGATITVTMPAPSKVTITGSGDATFACDGEVAANIMGSGHVTVRGSARCRVQSMGSGSLVVEPREGKAA